VLLIAPADAVQPVRRAVESLGTLLPFHVALDGVEVL
jgi:hypothetical protein